MLELAVGPDVEIEQQLFETMLTYQGRINPYPTYKMLHEKAPIYKTSVEAIILVRYDDCHHLLRDNRFGKDTSRQARIRQLQESPNLNLTEQEIQRILDFFDNRVTLLFMNPPDHTRLRNLVSRAFTPKRVQSLEPRINAMTRSLLDELSEEAEIMEAVAWKLPAMVICELLGIPDQDREALRPLVRSSARLLEPLVDKEVLFEGINCSLKLEQYLTELVAQKRKRQDDDLISALIQARDGADLLSEKELISTSLLLFGAGFETTTNLIGNGLLALLRHPDQAEALRQNLGLMPLAVEELLRYDSPVQFDGRSALEDVELFGLKLSAGTQVMTILAAANHDPTHFTNPEKLDITRQEGPPLSFASGIHYCLGASLARLEGSVFFKNMFTTFKSIELKEEPAWRDSITLRGLKHLNVELKRA
jgi:cytochrome P450